MYFNLSWSSPPPADVLPADPLHPQSAPEKDPLFHLPADDAAAGAVYVWHVPDTVHEDDLPSPHDPANSNQVRLRQFCPGKMIFLKGFKPG